MKQSRSKKNEMDGIGRSFMKFGKNFAKYSGDSIRDRDIYGQAISLNYKGNDTFKTVPGGLLSILLLILILAYTFLKGKYMVDKEEWSLIQQTVMASKQDLALPKNLSNNTYSNITLAIQFYEKREK